jgi:hypothetical protein
MTSLFDDRLTHPTGCVLAPFRIDLEGHPRGGASLPMIFQG